MSYVKNLLQPQLLQEEQPQLLQLLLLLHPHPQPLLFPLNVKSSSNKKFEFVFKSTLFVPAKIESKRTSKTSCEKSIRPPFLQIITIKVFMRYFF